METYTEILSQTANLTEAPEYIRVLPLGYVSSEKGDFLVDNESFRMMKEHMEHRAIDIVIDYEHQTLKDVQAPAGGWIKELVLKSNGIFAKVEWTKKAKYYLQNREYRYLSPVVLVRKKDRKVSQLHSVALTNTPAINGMIPIVNSEKPHLQTDTKLDDTQKKICRMLNMSESDFAKYGMWGDADE
ncbi:phage protease [Roseburia faecis]|uniref:phage protease n=1 Tax=Roseburia faecis TaxID=301302 RepID=UPI003F969848